MKRFVFFSLFILPISVFAEGGLPNQPYVYVVGKAEIQKPADVVTLRFNLIVTDLNEGKANQQIQAKAAKTFAILDEGKIQQNEVIAEDLKIRRAIRRERRCSQASQVHRLQTH